ncbi:MAG: hypothetical protein HKL85_02045 [Acidimicrobiaceae bacterium]|nr:hypothetical protein [Acidimicrobiaceae bacterium]
MALDRLAYADFCSAIGAKLSETPRAGTASHQRLADSNSLEPSVALALYGNPEIFNTRPRKTLGWKTPAEAFDKHLQPIQRAGVTSTG